LLVLVNLHIGVVWGVSETIGILGIISRVTFPLPCFRHNLSERWSRGTPLKVAHRYNPTDWIDPRIEVRTSQIHGKGMFAIAAIGKGQVVTIWGGTLLLTAEDIGSGKAKRWRSNGYVWGTVGEGLYLARFMGIQDDLTEYINHSCDPNVWMRDEVTLETRQIIKVGEELFLDYAMIEGDEEHICPWTCRCGTRFCRSKITGKDWRISQLQQRYRNHFSPFINERIKLLRQER
jgi:uncharacterized protein